MHPIPGPLLLNLALIVIVYGHVALCGEVWQVKRPMVVNPTIFFRADCKGVVPGSRHIVMTPCSVGHDRRVVTLVSL